MPVPSRLPSTAIQNQSQTRSQNLPSPSLHNIPTRDHPSPSHLGSPVRTLIRLQIHVTRRKTENRRLLGR
jgi:hypothetical protein